MAKETGLKAWNKFLSLALQMPGVKVDRKTFLEKEFSPFCSPEQLKQIVEQSPVAAVDIRLINHLADSCIKNHTRIVTATSTAAGIPGGPAMAVTVPGDIAQYYYHVLVLSQKLAYLYGFPDLCDEDGNITSENSRCMLTSFVGIMSGVAVANNVLRDISKRLGEQAAKRISQIALTKTVYYPVIKKIGKWLGIRITKSNFGKAVGKSIPVIGGVVSGAFTYAGFRPGAKRLQKQFIAQRDFLNAGASKKPEEAEFAEYEDVGQ